MKDLSSDVIYRDYVEDADFSRRLSRERRIRAAQLRARALTERYSERTGRPRGTAARTTED